VLFLPGETFFSAAQEHEPQLIEMGWEQHVVIATPATLITLLRMVALGWRQEKLAQNAQEISRLGQQLYERLAKMSEHMRRLGKNLQTSVNTYNETVGTMESRVLASARKFHELGAAPSGDSIDDLEPLEVMTREFQRLEFSPMGVGNGDLDRESHS
jgi:DNA recombination protein RmuC